MRNPLTAALASMALHALLGLAAGWRFPCLATFVAAGLAIGGAVAASARPPRRVGTLAVAALAVPGVIPLPLAFAVFASFAVVGLPMRTEPLANLAVAIPSLSVLILLLIL